MRSLLPVHPGEILREEFLAPIDMSADARAKRLDVPRTRIERLVAETALRLARFFGSSPEFWLSMRAAYDLSVERDRLADEIEAIPPLERAA